MRHLLGYCRPDDHDPRDHLFAAAEAPVPEPPAVDLSDKLPAPWDQGNLGSCTGHGSAGAIAFLHQGFMPSRLQLYGQGRQLEGTFTQDAGAMIRDVVKQAAKLGVAPETDWPYVVSKFARAWPAKATADGAKHLISTYERVTALDGFYQALARGFPVIVGLTLYQSFESDAVAQSGVVPMPQKGEQPLGGHCVLVVGYDKAAGTFKVRNSWGTGWGDGGHFHLPAAYLASPKLTSDCWVVKA